MEIESPISGVLLKILENEDSEVPVGKPIAFIGIQGEQLPNLTINAKTTQKTEESQKHELETRTGSSRKDRIRASPLARKLAKNHGIIIDQVQGTGAGGKITKEDVLSFIDSKKDRRVIEKTFRLKGMQKIIAQRMSRSVHTAAHCSITIEVDASRIKELRLKLQMQSNSKKPSKVSLTAIVLKAAAIALRENPIFNSTLEDDEIKIFADINIGVAIEIEKDELEGLVVPVIQKVDKKSILEINNMLQNKIEAARKGRSSLEELSGGTFTITNLGMYGIKSFIPIINPPETAILGLGSIIEKPVAIDGKLVVKPIFVLALTFDHRIINGAPAARFLKRLKEILESKI
jgi:pyruvate dehydrogenase E2 component (dihydrolipoamide acetyltransferase)